MIAQMFNPTAKLVITTGTQTNEINAEIETLPVIVEAKLSKFSALFKHFHVFLYFHSLNHYVLFHLKDNSCFINFS